jgi:hypothetical protein
MQGPEEERPHQSINLQPQEMEYQVCTGRDYGV